jgi:hypothetical protein
MSDEEREQRDDIKPPDEIARRLSAPPDPVARWRREANERVHRRQAAKDELIYKRYEGPQPAAETRAGWNRWLDARLEQEREFTIQLIMETVGDVVAKLRVEPDDKRDAELEAKFAKLWGSLTQAHRSIVEISRNNVERTFRAFDGDPAKKMN